MNLKQLFKPKTQVSVGDKAPLFALPSATGELVNLRDFIGKKIIVLYFYPKDDTYGCIAESCDFRDHYEVFKQAAAEVIGVSSDGPESHAKFSAKYKLPFILLSDEKNEVRRLYGVPSTFGMIPGRVTYVIDKQGVIRHVFNSQFNPASHVSQALKIVNGLTN